MIIPIKPDTLHSLLPFIQTITFAISSIFLFLLLYNLYKNNLLKNQTSEKAKIIKNKIKKSNTTYLPLLGFFLITSFIIPLAGKGNPIVDQEKIQQQFNEYPELKVLHSVPTNNIDPTHAVAAYEAQNNGKTIRCSLVPIEPPLSFEKTNLGKFSCKNTIPGK